MVAKILVPVDSSETTRKTVQAIIARKEQFPVPLTLLHIVEIDRLAYRMIPDFQLEMIRDKAIKAGEALLREVEEAFSGAGLTVETRLEAGSARELIVRIANEEDFQLLILGRRGMGEIRDVLFGSVVNHVLHQVRCPVLLF